MKKIKPISETMFLLALLLLVGAGCTSRMDMPLTDTDSTIVFPPKNAADISAKVTLCRKIQKKTGSRIGEGAVFTVMEKEWIRAVVDLENRFFYGNRNLMFHFDWIGANGRSFYKKRIDLSPDDSSSTINSSISLSPETRQPGDYILRLYFFRELIAEKKFKVLPKFQVTTFINDGLTSNITLCREVDKKTGKRIGLDSVFIIKKKEKVRAYFDFEDRFEYGNRELLFRFDWIKGDSTPFYRKRIDLPADDPSLTIGSSISIGPEKREPGEYILQLYLFNELVGEKKFELRSEPKVIPVRAKDIIANIILYRKLDKKTGERIDEGTLFTIKNKRSVRALVNIKNPSEYSNRELKFQLDWIGPDGKSFYRKKVVLAPGETNSTINSSVSIAPDKRQPGEYIFRISLNNETIAEKKFELR